MFKCGKQHPQRRRRSNDRISDNVLLLVPRVFSSPASFGFWQTAVLDYALMDESVTSTLSMLIEKLISSVSFNDLRLQEPWTSDRQKNLSSLLSHVNHLLTWRLRAMVGLFSIGSQQTDSYSIGTSCDSAIRQMWPVGMARSLAA